MTSLKKRMRGAIAPIFPKLTRPLFRYTHERHIARLERRLGPPELSKKISQLTRGRILSGPFEGTQYVGHSRGSMYCPKLIGSYELEIQPWINRAISAQHSVFVDVGCAEGYYAIGFAKRSPDTRVFAYDIDPRARRLTGDLARLNGVDAKVHVRAECNQASFAALPAGRTLALCDCEGYESHLLDPAGTGIAEGRCARRVTRSECARCR